MLQASSNTVTSCCQNPISSCGICINGFVTTNANSPSEEPGIFWEQCRKHSAQSLLSRRDIVILAPCDSVVESWVVVSLLFNLGRGEEERSVEQRYYFILQEGNSL